VLFHNNRVATLQLSLLPIWLFTITISLRNLSIMLSGSAIISSFCYKALFTSFSDGFQERSTVHQKEFNYFFISNTMTNTAKNSILWTI